MTMNISRAVALLRACRKPLVAAALAWMLLFSVLASASPSLHHWVHADDRAPSHYCLVTTLDHGHNDVTSVRVAIPLPVSQTPVVALPCESFFISHDKTLFPERGPPALS
jgi:hypothetical protein